MIGSGGVDDVEEGLMIGSGGVDDVEEGIDDRKWRG